MFDGLQYAFQLQRLQANKRSIIKKYKKLYDQAKQQKKSDAELDATVLNERSKKDYVDDLIWRLQMQYLSQQAEKYLLPRPKFNQDSGEWIESDVTGHWRLSQNALVKLRTAIRKEQKERREHWKTWIPLLTGLVGALIGLVALL